MTSQEILDQAEAEFLSQSGKARRYAIGMLIAFIDLIRTAKGDRRYSSLDDFFVDFPRQTTAHGRPLSTLTISVNGTNLGIRRFYGQIETFFRHKHHRWDFPKAPGYGTSKWEHFRGWLDVLVDCTDDELASLRGKAVDFVLATLRSQEFDPSTAMPREPLLFSAVLRDFQFKHAGEKEGAALQGAVFGFLRADNPHLQVEPRGSRTGSRRQKGVGDIDCWEANRLVISAEVKQIVFHRKHVEQEIIAFADDIRQRGALGFLVALSFDSTETKDVISAHGLKPLSVGDMQQLVDFWDPLKQRAAVNAFIYFLAHIERNSALLERLEDFIARQRAAGGAKLDPTRRPADPGSSTISLF